MAKQTSKMCRHCQRMTLHVKHQMVSDSAGCLLSAISLGMFLLIWIPLGMIDMAFQPWRCQTCGSKN